MKITLLVDGKLSGTPEGKLALDYAQRATASGRSLGIGPVEIVEIDQAKGKLESHLEGARIIACDERGKAWASRPFAEHIGKLRDGGERKLVFLIGPADGHDPAIRARAHEMLAFGPQTWPHALARAMLAEQVYRAVTILGGGPYHRD